jgi:hypothetical protein
MNITETDRRNIEKVLLQLNTAQATVHNRNVTIEALRRQLSVAHRALVDAENALSRYPAANEHSAVMGFALEAVRGALKRLGA